ELECYDSERGRERIKPRILEVREYRRALRHGLGLRTGGERLAVPQAGVIVPIAMARGEPQAIHADGAQLAVVGIIDGHVTHRSALAVSELGDPRLEVPQGVGLAAVDRHEDRAAGNARRAE